jgi:hypothetical protein
MQNTRHLTRNATIQTIPAWACSGKGFAAFMSALALADLEGKWVRISATQQMDFFNSAPFGKRAIFSDGVTVRAIRQVCFGADIDEQTFSIEGAR